MDMAPAVFWSLTVHEFWIKHRAFIRAEDKARSITVELALMTGQHDNKSIAELTRKYNELRRYPIKSWLYPWLPPPR